jgi:hypothetical protein
VSVREGLGRVGVIANPCAGAGPDVLRGLLARLLPSLPGADVILAANTFEAAAADACGLECRKVRGPVGDAGGLTRELLEAGVDTVIGVGGDGTLGDIGSVLASAGSVVRLLGVGVGSSNVGPLVGTTAAELDGFLASPWTDVPVHALDVRCDGAKVGLAFHDATVANTFFGTRDGLRVDLDAAAALRGEDRVADPSSACGQATWIAKNGQRRLAGAQLEGGQIVASPLNDTDACRGKVVSGFLCWGPYVGCLGIVAAASALMIRTRLGRSDLEAAEPLRLFHLGLAPDDVVEMGGFRLGCALVVDGTPRCATSPVTTVSLRTVERAVVSIRRAASGAGAPEREESE